MTARLEATLHLREEKAKIQRVKDERSSTPADHYFVIKVGALTVFADPIALDNLIKSLRAVRKRQGFDRVHEADQPRKERSR